MTNNEKIESLKRKQARKQKQIQRYQKKMKKDILRGALLLSAITLIGLNQAYKIFGTTTNFLITSISILLLFSISYFIFVRYLTYTRKKEIKIIKGKLYKLMKLREESA